MARRRKQPPHENHDRWLVSYADFITLLFAFFVVMFASSQADKGRAQQVSASVRQALENGQVAAVLAGILGGAVGDRGKGNAMMRGPGGAQKATKEPPSEGQGGQGEGPLAELVPSMRFLESELKEEISGGRITVALQARGLTVSLREAAVFPSGDDTINRSAYPIIEKVAQTIRKLPNPVRVEGHTDSLPIHTPRFRSNWELSTARAIAVLEHLTTQCDVPRERLAVAGYAETVPVADNAAEDGRSRNRRVDLVILNKVGQRSEPEGRSSASPEHAAPPSDPHSSSKTPAPARPSPAPVEPRR